MTRIQTVVIDGFVAGESIGDVGRTLNVPETEIRSWFDDGEFVTALCGAMLLAIIERREDRPPFKP